MKRMKAERLLEQLLTSSPTAVAATTAAEYLDRVTKTLAGWSDSADRAVIGGFSADRLGFAFAAGYPAALSALVPDVALGPRICLCATEDGGAHPKAIKTRLAPDGGGKYLLSGEKRWATLAPVAKQALVVASVGEDDAGKNRLRVARVSLSAPGVTIEAMPETPFAPEVPHAVVRFESVRVANADLLPGDGYDRYLKPFRTVEDLHIHLALFGYLVGVARRNNFSKAFVERALAAIVTARALAFEDALSSSVHIALAGALDLGRRLVEELEPEWSRVPEAERERWERDRALFSVASRARAARREAAWARYGRPSVIPPAG